MEEVEGDAARGYNRVCQAEGIKQKRAKKCRHGLDVRRHVFLCCACAIERFCDDGIARVNNTSINRKLFG